MGKLSFNQNDYLKALKLLALKFLSKISTPDFKDLIHYFFLIYLIIKQLIVAEAIRNNFKICLSDLKPTAVALCANRVDTAGLFIFHLLTDVMLDEYNKYGDNLWKLNTDILRNTT